MCMCILCQSQDDLCVWTDYWTDLQTTLCMDYWADLKMTYAYGLFDRPPDNLVYGLLGRPMCMCVLGRLKPTKVCRRIVFGLESTSLQGRAVSDLEPTYVLRCT